MNVRLCFLSYYLLFDNYFNKFFDFSGKDSGDKWFVTIA